MLLPPQALFRDAVYGWLALMCFAVCVHAWRELVRVNGGAPELSRNLMAKIAIFAVGGISFLLDAASWHAARDTFSFAQCIFVTAYVIESFLNTRRVRRMERDLKHHMASLKRGGDE